jgi:hypothetical protein
MSTARTPPPGPVPDEGDPRIAARGDASGGVAQSKDPPQVRGRRINHGHINFTNAILRAGGELVWRTRRNPN